MSATEREVADNDAAPAAIQAIFGDIRETTGSRLVNLIFRRLATNGPLLEKVWSAVRPIYSGGALSVRVNELIHRTSSQIEHKPRISAASLGELPHSDVDVLRALCRTYLTNNARNLLAFRSLQGRSGKAEAGVSPRSPPSGAGKSLVELPPLPDYAALPEETGATIRRLNRYGDTQTPQDLASFYLHISYWPSFLTEVELRLQRLSVGLDFVALRQNTLAHADDLVAPALAKPAFSQKDMQALEELTGSLVSVTIPKMIPICIVVERLLPGPR